MKHASFIARWPAAATVTRSGDSAAVPYVGSTSIRAIRSLATNVRSDQIEERAGLFLVRLRR
jgi:hypothetical protein